MSWLKKLLPPKIKREAPSRKSIPEGLWSKCVSCEAVLYRSDLDSNLGCAQVRTSSTDQGAGALDMLLDPEGRFEVGAEVVPVDPLKFRTRAAIPTVSPPPPTIPAKPMRWS